MSRSEIQKGRELIITHGNGPQVGLLALQAAAYKPDQAFPLAAGITWAEPSSVAA
jgi:carbamate kinase